MYLDFDNKSIEHFEYDADGVRQFLPSMSMEAQGDLGVKFFLTNIRDHKDWMFNASFGPDAERMMERQNAYTKVAPVLGHGWVLDTQNQYRADLARIRDEYMWKAITGKANTTTDWDTYVSQWLKAGGQNVLDEARSYKQPKYLVSEKYDGVRAIWTGTQFVTRKGNIINAPSWFISPLPNVWLDGELWTKREHFSALSGIVRTKKPN